MKWTILLVTVLVASGLASPVLASPGDLDTTFGNNGTVVTSFLDSDGTPSATSIVTNTKDSGAGSLRQAILDANDRTGADTINFAIPDDPNVAGYEVKTISPDSSLPAITDPVTIDGYTQTGATPNALATKGTNAVLKIELSGKDSPQGARGIMIRTSDSVIRGLVINRFDVNVQICDCTNPTVAKRTNNRIEGNFIGTNPTGTASRGGGEVLLFEDAPGNFIGGDTPAARNLISATEGFAAVDIRSAGNEIDGNLIGTARDGKSPLGNRGTGLFISGNRADDNAVGLSAPNIMAFNSGGVLIMGSGSGGNGILFNSIFDNLGPGIDLGGDNRTPNDSSDLDTGANGLQNFPVIASARNTATTTIVKGKLNSIPNHEFVLQFFSNPRDSRGEGKNLIGKRVVTTDDKGDADFVLRRTPKAKEGLYVTATATNQSTGDTSEFSPPRAVVP